jgi:hypothetical protein
VREARAKQRVAGKELRPVEVAQRLADGVGEVRL